MRHVPDDVARAFKAWCATNGKTMTAALIDLMRSVAKKGRK